MTNVEVAPTTKHVVCSICDIGCQLRAEAVDGRLARILPHENPILAKNVCYNGTAAPRSTRTSPSPSASAICCGSGSPRGAPSRTAARS